MGHEAMRHTQLGVNVGRLASLNVQADSIRRFMLGEARDAEVETALLRELGIVVVVGLSLTRRTAHRVPKRRIDILRNVRIQGDKIVFTRDTERELIIITTFSGGLVDVEVAKARLNVFQLVRE